MLSKKRSTSGDTFTAEHPNVKNTPRGLVRFRIADTPELKLDVYCLSIADNY